LLLNYPFAAGEFSAEMREKAGLEDTTGGGMGMVKEVVEELSPAFKTVLVDNITSMKWTKLFINVNNCIPALLGKSIQETFSDLGMSKLGILILKECFVIHLKTY